ncbi:hypothetical protein QYM36_007711 [Artemia franciscana]|uniref:ATP-dependent DNA helicase n=1 Tax=Artemia franciscana TaxID=6661 RepID=A0AA88IUF5_ARTSF|nr:hypothetical protein QYM36_007711 [Artemia franciscana]
MIHKKDNEHDPEKTAILLSAPTGKAGCNIRGSILHYALSLPVSQGMKNFKDLTADKLNQLRVKLTKLKLLITDEVSIEGAKMFEMINRRLKQIMGTEQDFGGVLIPFCTSCNPSTSFHIQHIGRYVQGSKASKINNREKQYTAKDSIKGDVVQSVKQYLPGKAKHIPGSESQGLSFELRLAIKERIEYTVNIEVTDHLANGSKGTVLALSDNIIWSLFKNAGQATRNNFKSRFPNEVLRD